MFDTINGVPLHPLVVHGVVVLLPLSILGTVAIAARPAWRRTYGLLVVGLTASATALVPIAVWSGRELKTRVGDPGKHQDLGEQLIWFSLTLLVLVVALVALEGRTPTEGVGNGRTALTVVAALVVVAAVATGIQVFRVGDSGARQTWCTVADCEPVR